MKIIMLETFGNYLKGTTVEVSEQTGAKLVKIGKAKSASKELNVDDTKEEKVSKRKTK